jgi:myo-inositol-1(or 4)-monophosphatase
MNHNALINSTFKIMRLCCQHLIQGYDRLNSSAPTKEDKQNFIESIDADIQKILISKLKNLYPKHLFVAEEPSDDTAFELPDHPDVWVIDPIDGSNNYMHHIPTFSISICYYYQGQRTAALVYDPINDELFTATRGGGALRNQRRMYHKSSPALDQVLCGIEGRTGFHPSVESKVRSTRKLGCTSLTLCYAACGRFDMAVCQSPHLWDAAAGLLIAEESGMVCYNEHFKPYQDSDKELHVSSSKVRDLLDE